MSYLEELIARARKALPEEDEKSQHTINRDFFDKRSWLYVKDQIPALGEMVDKMGEQRPTSPQLQEDFFNIFNQGDPRLLDVDQVDPEFRINRTIAEGLLNADDLKIVRKYTRYDDFASARAVMSLQDRLDDQLAQAEVLRAALEAAMENLHEALQQAQEALDAQEGDGEGEPAAVELGEALAAFADVADLKMFPELLNTEAMVAEVLESLQVDEQLSSSYGVEPGQLQHMDFAERAALMQKLDRTNLKSFANLIGQWQIYADAERRRSIRNAPSEVVDVELGNRLERLPASEMANLAVPELEDLFWMRWAQHRLHQHVVRGAEHAGKGPIIVVCDESGSMHSKLGAHTREAWSKAVTLAFCDQARRQKRDFFYIGFSSAGQVWESRFPGGRGEPDDVINVVTHSFGGGTEFVGPLSRAMELVQEYRINRDQRLPDVVFMTDDACTVPPGFVSRWEEERAAAGIQCYGLQVGGTVTPKSTMRTLCDRTFSIDHLTSNPEDLKDLFRSI